LAKHAIEAGDKTLISGMKRLTKVYKCDEDGCSKVFHYKEGLDGHLIVDHGKENLKWNCKICSASYIHKRHHDRHMREKHLLDKHGNSNHQDHPKKQDDPKSNNRTNGQPEKSRCKICFFKFDSRLELDSHLIKEHEHEGKWECKECHSKFILRRHLHDHMTKIHKMDKDGTRINFENGFFKCSFCSSEFSTKEKLDSHLVQDHGHERSHQCDLCGIKFTHKKSFYRHKKIHETNPNHNFRKQKNCPKTKRHSEHVRKHEKLKKVEHIEVELNLSEFENLEIPENLEENGSKD